MNAKKLYQAGVSAFLIIGVSVLVSVFVMRAAEASKTVLNVPPPISVNVAVVKTTQLPETVSTLGSLSAIQSATISAQTNGRIQTIYFKNGQEVGENMPIVQLDDAQAKAAYESAVSTLKVDQAKYNRSKQVLNQAVSQQALDSIKADMNSAQANVESTQATLDEQKIVAPFDGDLGAFQVNQGDYVQAGTPIVTLVNKKELRVDYSLPEDLLPKLNQGQLVEVKVSAYPEKIFYGTVNYISPSVNKDTRTVSVEALVPNDKAQLSPGMFANVAEELSMNDHALVIPVEAVMADIKGYYVFKIVGNKAEQVYIKTGTHQGDQVQVLSGLNVGDVVVSAGQQKLDDGSFVTILRGTQ